MKQITNVDKDSNGKVQYISDIVSDACIVGNFSYKIEKYRIVDIIAKLMDTLADKGILDADEIMHICDYSDGKYEFVKDEKGEKKND